ncbi:hypothetical protein VOLCADRAFT_99987 [Volvox carteri f. nagariensis]|uniref:Uncharacterized protein n=1 Tax=Volvox carteri f. nagariensis TaxID=3068 RepID=D8UJ55_VOLCA|nr:uncharacterized protein VOLCADRAFT_99987 [Volvox carteri f. nagariensis]EFJ40247.1 hypothetical protein VOLCADRAFT_99987 [Volvox carteri f. nagariensis]|eukprot:XP_002958687.1 hypothetical protein VOLCADRAFT_99987 [Volvox carteri f. nagariensis]
MLNITFPSDYCNLTERSRSTARPSCLYSTRAIPAQHALRELYSAIGSHVYGIDYLTARHVCHAWRRALSPITRTVKMNLHHAGLDPAARLGAMQRAFPRVGTPPAEAPGPCCEHTTGSSGGGSSSGGRLMWQFMSITVGASVLPLNRDQLDPITHRLITSCRWVGQQLAAALAASQPALCRLRHLTSLELTADTALFAALVPQLARPGAAPSLTELRFTRAEASRGSLGRWLAAAAAAGGGAGGGGTGLGMAAAMEALGSLTGLKSLSLNAGLPGLPLAVSRLSHLAALELHHSGRGVTVVEDVAPLEALTGLSCLKLRYMALRDIWQLTRLTSLTSLDLTVRGFFASEGFADGEDELDELDNLDAAMLEGGGGGGDWFGGLPPPVVPPPPPAAAALIFPVGGLGLHHAIAAAAAAAAAGPGGGQQQQQQPLQFGFAMPPLQQQQQQPPPPPPAAAAAAALQGQPLALSLTPPPQSAPADFPLAYRLNHPGVASVWHAHNPPLPNPHDLFNPNATHYNHQHQPHPAAWAALGQLPPLQHQPHLHHHHFRQEHQVQQQQHQVQQQQPQSPPLFHHTTTTRQDQNLHAQQEGLAAAAPLPPPGLAGSGGPVLALGCGGGDGDGGGGNVWRPLLCPFPGGLREGGVGGERGPASAALSAAADDAAAVAATGAGCSSSFGGGGGDATASSAGAGGSGGAGPAVDAAGAAAGGMNAVAAAGATEDVYDRRPGCSDGGGGGREEPMAGSSGGGSGDGGAGGSLVGFGSWMFGDGGYESDSDGAVTFSLTSSAAGSDYIAEDDGGGGGGSGSGIPGVLGDRLARRGGGDDVAGAAAAGRGGGTSVLPSCSGCVGVSGGSWWSLREPPEASQGAQRQAAAVYGATFNSGGGAAAGGVHLRFDESPATAGVKLLSASQQQLLGEPEAMAALAAAGPPYGSNLLPGAASAEAALPDHNLSDASGPLLNGVAAAATTEAAPATAGSLLPPLASPPQVRRAGGGAGGSGSAGGDGRGRGGGADAGTTQELSAAAAPIADADMATATAVSSPPPPPQAGGGSEGHQAAPGGVAEAGVDAGPAAAAAAAIVEEGQDLLEADDDDDDDEDDEDDDAEADEAAAELEAAEVAEAIAHEGSLSRQLWQVVAALPGLRSLNVNAWHEAPLDDERLGELAKLSLPWGGQLPVPSGLTSLGLLLQASSASARLSSLSDLRELKDLTLVVAPPKGSGGRLPPPAAAAVQLSVLDIEYDSEDEMDDKPDGAGPSAAHPGVEVVATGGRASGRTANVGEQQELPPPPPPPPQQQQQQQQEQEDATMGDLWDNGGEEAAVEVDDDVEMAPAPAHSQAYPAAAAAPVTAAMDTSSVDGDGPGAAAGIGAAAAGSSPVYHLAALTALERLRLYDDPGALPVDQEAAKFLSVAWSKLNDIYILGSITLQRSAGLMFSRLAHLDLFNQTSTVPYRVQLHHLPPSLRALGVQNAVLEGANRAGQLQSVLEGLSLYATVHWPLRANGGTDMYDWIAGCDKLARSTWRVFWINGSWMTWQELEIWNVYGTDWNLQHTDFTPLARLTRLRSLKMEALPPFMAFRIRRIMREGVPYCKVRLVADNEMPPEALMPLPALVAAANAVAGLRYFNMSQRRTAATICSTAGRVGQEAAKGWRTRAFWPLY